MARKAIAGCSDCAYLINPSEVISFADLALLVKYEAVEVISKAIRDKSLNPYYFSKVSIIDNKERLFCYKFYFLYDYTYEYMYKLDNIVFLKSEVQLLKGFDEGFRWMKSSHSLAEKSIIHDDNVIPALKKIIKKSRSEPPNVQYSLVGLLAIFGDLLLCLCGHIFFWIASKIVKKPKLSDLTGYDATINPFDPELYVKENPYHSKEEKLVLFKFLRDKGYTQGQCAQYIDKDKDIEEDSFRVVGCRLEHDYNKMVEETNAMLYASK